jgi:hypothetical protein
MDDVQRSGNQTGALTGETTMALQSIRVKDLIELLQDQDEGALVVFGVDYGDRSHTEQAIPLRGEVEDVQVTESAYSSSGYAIAEPDEDEEPTEDTYLVIR